ncbi:MAG: hypothetical protein UX65_C0002G0008 [Parcubacteria group bacterium GW2011_GWB1_46_8]|nr:MAG: hypothetical protein UX65_C0002G0008 [Parcubacteria group bacterium GW2011_GWB1_46_8]
MKIAATLLIWAGGNGDFPLANYYWRCVGNVWRLDVPRPQRPAREEALNE